MGTTRFIFEVSFTALGKVHGSLSRAENVRNTHLKISILELFKNVFKSLIHDFIVDSEGCLLLRGFFWRIDE